MSALVTTIVAVLAIAALTAAVGFTLAAVTPRLSADVRERGLPLLLLLPLGVLLAGWIILPALQTMWLAVVADGRFAAVDHLRWLASAGGGRTAVRNTVLWLIAVPVGSVVAALALAWLAERAKARRLITTVILIPAVIALAAVAVIWRVLLAFRPAGTDQVGLLNLVVTQVGLDPAAWLVQPTVNTVLLAGAMIWVGTGMSLLVLSAAIAKVPEEVRDAARVDGASESQVFTRVTAPSVRGAILVAAAASGIAAVRAFDLVWITTGGAFGSEVAATEAIDQALIGGQVGRGAAVAVVSLLLVAPLVAVLVGRVRRAERLRSTPMTTPAEVPA